MCVPGCQDALRRFVSRRGLMLGGAAAATLSATAGAIESRPPPERRFRDVIDLTHTMSAEFPTFFGTPGIEMQQGAKFKTDGYNLYWWRINEHAGTHLDAPIHFSQNGIAADEIVPETLVVPLAVIDVTRQAASNPDYLLSPADIEAWERTHGRLPGGCCVAMHSGWGDLATTDPARFIGRDVNGDMHFPGIAPATAEWLLKERQVAGLAVDTLSLDHGMSKDFATHLLWLPTGRWGLENVANLDKAPPVGSTLLVGLPKVKGATGGPVRLLALL